MFVTFGLKLARIEVRKLARSPILIVAEMKLKKFSSDRSGLKRRSVLLFQAGVTTFNMKLHDAMQ